MLKRQKLAVIFGLFLMLKLFLFFYFHYINAERTQMWVANRLYSTWHAVLADSPLDAEDIHEQLPNNSRIFFEHDENGNVRTFYQTGNWQPPLIDGEFFDQDTSTAHAVVGIHVLNDLEDRAYFTLEGFTYEVIGVLGVGFPSSLDYLVLLNGNNRDLPVIRVVIDTQQPEAMDLITDIFDVRTVNENQALDHFLNNHVFGQLIRINVTLISIFLVILISYSYFNLSKNTSYVRYLLGDHKRKIWIHHLLTLSGLFVASFMVIQMIDLITREQIISEAIVPYFIIFLGVCSIYSIVFYFDQHQGGFQNGDA